MSNNSKLTDSKAGEGASLVGNLGCPCSSFFSLWQRANLIYGQVKKCYRQRKLVRVTPVMRLGTEADLKAALQGLGFSGRLNTAFIERVNLTVRDARLSSGKTDLGHRTVVPTSLGTPGMVACVLSFCASAPSTARGARAAP
jgi:hypothetical protein